MSYFSRTMETNIFLIVIISFSCISCWASENENDGYCTFEVKKQRIVNVPVPYDDIETFHGRCNGYYFRRCLNQRKVQKIRMTPQLEVYTENVRRCCDGYILNIYNDKCLPICEHSCINGNCTEPNTCTCNDGYVLEENSRNKCVPDCQGCENGKCILPNLCYCNAGYDWNQDKIECVAICSGGCHNGKCESPEHCECNDGYIHHPTESVCIPNCENQCIKGVCIEPNKCECFTDHKFINGSDHECEPICELSCKNAVCVEPNVCKCHSGFKVHDKPHECHCGDYCIEIDDECHCLDENHRVSGAGLRSNDSTICTEENCLNGFCETPYDCECFEGFEKDENFSCVAVNETCIDDPSNCNSTNTQACDCINGVCAVNNTCFCVKGFKMSEKSTKRCEPVCSNECVNGFCINPNACHCDDGYQLSYNETEWNICHPICDPDIDEKNGCSNGNCIAPGLCECFSGFETSQQHNFTCVPSPYSAAKSMISFTVILVSVIFLAIALIVYFHKQKNDDDDAPFERIEVSPRAMNESENLIHCDSAEEL